MNFFIEVIESANIQLTPLIRVLLLTNRQIHKIYNNLLLLEVMLQKDKKVTNILSKVKFSFFVEECCHLCWLEDAAAKRHDCDIASAPGSSDVDGSVDIPS